MAYADAGERKIFSTINETDQGPRLLLMTLEESRSLLHEGEFIPSGFHDLTDRLDGKPVAMLPGNSGDSLIVATDTDKLLYFAYNENSETWEKRQTIPSPLGDGERMTTVNWLFGDMSLVLGGDRGRPENLQPVPPTRRQTAPPCRSLAKPRSFPP